MGVRKDTDSRKTALSSSVDLDSVDSRRDKSNNHSSSFAADPPLSTFGSEDLPPPYSRLPTGETGSTDMQDASTSKSMSHMHPVEEGVELHHNRDRTLTVRGPQEVAYVSLSHHSNYKVDGDCVSRGPVNLEHTCSFEVSGNATLDSGCDMFHGCEIEVDGDAVFHGQARLGYKDGLVVKGDATFNGPIHLEQSSYLIVQGTATFEGIITGEFSCGIYVLGKAYFGGRVTARHSSSVLYAQGKGTIPPTAVTTEFNSRVEEVDFEQEPIKHGRIERKTGNHGRIERGRTSSRCLMM